MGIKTAPRKFNTSNTYSRPNHYSRPGNGSSYVPVRFEKLIYESQFKIVFLFLAKK